MPPESPKCMYLGALLAALSFAAGADTLPLWEVQVGVGGIHVPYYRGARDSYDYALPVPLVFYRGDRLRVDDGGIEGILYRGDRLKLDISLAGGLPARSKNDSSRANMPDLNPSVEFGPSAKLTLLRKSNGHHGAWLVLPLRAAYIVDDLAMKPIGWTFSPYAEYQRRFDTWQTTLSAGPLFASEDYHSYYYDVAARYATAARPQYHAAGGYSGLRLTLRLKRRTPKSRLLAYLRYDRLQGAVFAASPLVERETYLAAGAVWTWQVAKSSRPAVRGDDKMEPSVR